MSDFDSLLDWIKSTDMEMRSGKWGRLRQTANGFLRVGMMVFKNRKPESFIPSLEDVKKIVLSLSQLKGVAMKFGQMMSYFDLAMPDELKEALSLLQTQSPSMPFVLLKQQIEADLPEQKARILLTTLEHEPIAAASIGQVHRAEIKGQQVVVKVQYPQGICLSPPNPLWFTLHPFRDRFHCQLEPIGTLLSGINPDFAFRDWAPY